jgi:ankyrin repeat protein
MSLPRSLRRILAAVLLATGCSLACSNRADMTPPNKYFLSGPQAALEIAIRADDRDGVARALANGASANATGRFLITPLMIAVDAQRLRAVEALLLAGALPNAVAQDRNGPVSLAVRSVRAAPSGRDIMLRVFHAGGDPDTRQPDGDPILMRFILDHDAEGLRLMKSLGAHLDILDRAGDPLLTNVAMSQDWDMVWALIELGAEVDYEHGRSRQPLSLAFKTYVPARDSPLYAYKLKTWHFLKGKGIALPPMDRPAR